MTEAARPEDYRLLGIGEDATEEQANRAYHRMKALYADGSLATYALLDDDERAQMQAAIERAHMRVTIQIREKGAVAARHGPGVPDAAPVHAPAVDEGILGVGALLRHHREKMGLTVKDVSVRTRIRATHLENIEAERFADLPALVYLRGFLLEYARTLGLRDPDALVARYLQRFTESRR